MSQKEREAERQRVLAMIDIEEELGPVVSGGPARDAVAGTRTSQRNNVSYAFRARERVRFLARAVPAAEKQAA